MTTPRAVIFDFGNVLVRWDPRPAVAVVLGEEEARRFFEEFDFDTWNRGPDSGQSWDDALADLEARAPEFAEHGRTYREHFVESLRGGVIAENERFVRSLHEHGVPVFGLTNWSTELYYEQALPRLTFVEALDDVLVSGDVGLAKPDPRIYRLAAERFGVEPAETVFIDDSPANVATARELGFDAIVFTDPDQLRRDLTARHLPV